MDNQGTAWTTSLACSTGGVVGGSLTAGLEAERRALYLAFASDDAKEGLTAFTEKRRPEFRGR